VAICPRTKAAATGITATAMRRAAPWTNLTGSFHAHSAGSSGKAATPLRPGFPPLPFVVWSSERATAYHRGYRRQIGNRGKRRHTWVGMTDNPPTIPISGISRMRVSTISQTYRRQKSFPYPRRNCQIRYLKTLPYQPCAYKLFEVDYDNVFHVSHFSFCIPHLYRSGEVIK
jgi:hypothetical protein